MNPPLSLRVRRVLRESPIPIPTPVIELLCFDEVGPYGANRSRGTKTHLRAVLLRLERYGMVRRCGTGVRHPGVPGPPPTLWEAAG